MHALVDTDDLSEHLRSYPPDVGRLLETAVTNFVRWDILLALAEEGEERPLSLDHLAAYVGREPATLIPELGALASLGIIVRGQEAGHTTYSVKDDVWPAVSQFAALCEEPDVRTFILAWVLDHSSNENDESV